MRNPFSLRNSLENEDREVSDFAERFDFEESLADLNAREERLERPGESRVKFGLIWLLVILGFSAILGRLYFVAVARHDYFREVAEGNRLRIEYLQAPRGVIYDTTGAVLVSNIPSFELVANPLDLPKNSEEKTAVIQKVADILNAPAEEILAILAANQERQFGTIYVRQNLTREQTLILREQTKNLPGFRVVNAPMRDYANPRAFSHLLGYVGKVNEEEYQILAASGYRFNDTLGKTGLEQIYEPYLRGTAGELQVEVDARGAVQKTFGEKAAHPGNNLFLNIDQGLQEALFNSLTRTLKNLNRQRAAAVAMDPRTGKILALLSFPTYDNSLFAQGISDAEYQKLESDPNLPLFNRTISGAYPPGSTVKPMVAAAALQEGVILPQTQIDDRGYIVIKNIYGGPDSYFYGYSRKALGLVDARTAIALSSDIYFYTVGGGYSQAKIDGLGIDRLAKYYKDFQIDQTLAIDLPGARPGLVPTPEWKKEQYKNDPVASRWYLGNTYHAAIGQGDLLATPLHVLSWTAAIANGGKVFRPYIAARITDLEGREVAKFEPSVIAELPIDQQYLEIVRQGMREVITDGTAKPLSSLSIAVAGKTGTAQFDAKDLSRAHAWFTAFAPYEDPQIAIVVLIEDGGEGSTAAVPVVREALDWWAKNRYEKSN